MVFDHVVKHNGMYYKAGENVPTEQETKKSSAPSIFTEEVGVSKTETKRRGRPAKAKE